MRLRSAVSIAIALLWLLPLQASAQSVKLDASRIVLTLNDVPIGWIVTDQFVSAAFVRFFNAPNVPANTNFIANDITPVADQGAAASMLRDAVRMAKGAPGNWTDTGLGSGIGDESVLLLGSNGSWYQVDFRKANYYLQMRQWCSDCGGQRDALTRAKKMEANIEAQLAPSPAPTVAPSPQPAACQFVLGFKTLHDLDAADIGDCLDNQASAANGNAEQHTVSGLMAWRKADNWTAFTNGYQTWINGPTGLVVRLNSQRFAWEADFGAPGTSAAL